MNDPQTNSRNVEDLIHADAYDSDGEKIGSVSDVFLNDETGQPDFIELSHGLFGVKSSIVPLRGHTFKEDDVHLAFAKDALKDAPEIGAEGHVAATERDKSLEHFGLTELDDVAGYQTRKRS